MCGGEASFKLPIFVTTLSTIDALSCCGWLVRDGCRCSRRFQTLSQHPVVLRCPPSCYSDARTSRHLFHLRRGNLSVPPTNPIKNFLIFAKNSSSFLHPPPTGELCALICKVCVLRALLVRAYVFRKPSFTRAVSSPR